MKHSTDVLELKVNLAQRLLALEDEQVLSQVAALLAVDNFDWWDDLDASDKESIRRADEDYAEGRVYSHEQVKAELDQWLQE